jgi:shikimate dehydrogenase
MTHVSTPSRTREYSPIINGSTQVCAIIGDPIEHTLSPAIHNAAFRSLKMDIVYVGFRVRESQLGRAIHGFKSVQVLGINVTMPHKSRVLRFLDKVDNTAQEIGAVNTIVRRGTALHGHNTDGEAALTSLSNHGSIAGSRALILGAGGAAKAIAYHLSKIAETMTVLNRTRSNGARLSSNIKKWSGIPTHSDTLVKKNLCREAGKANLLINTLPAHVFSRYGRILTEEKITGQGMFVMDVNYAPESNFLDKTRRMGAKAIDGLEMLIEQAALSFNLWTGMAAPIAVMRKAAVEARSTL